MPGIFKDAARTNEFSYNGAMVNPDSRTASSATGATIDNPIYLGNTDAASKLTNLRIECQGGDTNIYYLYAPDVAGVPGTFEPFLDLAEIVGAGIIKVWTRLVMAAGLPGQKRRTVRHRFTGKVVPL